MFIKIRAIKIDRKDRDSASEALMAFNQTPRKFSPRERARERDTEIEWPEGVDGIRDKMGFDLDGYRYDGENELLLIYTPFEYRIYVPCGIEQYQNFIEETDSVQAYNVPYNCLMVGYYMDPDFTTFRSVNPLLQIGFRWFFH